MNQYETSSKVMHSEMRQGDTTLPSHLISQQNASQSMLPMANSKMRVSRDEMNLAEFPLTVLSTRSDPYIKTLEFSDSVRGKNGEIVNRSWIITGADKFGLPTSSDDEVILGLLKLTVDNGFKDRKVYFTRYELLRVLRWTTEGRSYSRLQKALDRLSGVRIKATNAFYDNDLKAHSTRNFGLIDAYEINDGRDTNPKPSYFTWSETLFKSFQVGFIKKIDLDFYLDLKSAAAKRLYRYLDKHFWYKSKVHINLFTLSHDKIGVSRNYKFASSLKQQLDPAAEELVQAGFLQSFHYEGKGSATEIIFFAGSGREVKTGSEGKTSVAHATGKKGMTPSSVSKADSDELRVSVEQLLVERGLRESQALQLLQAQSEDMLQRIQKIISYFDELCAARSPLISRSPTGFLYRAVEKPAQFKLPGEIEGPRQKKLDMRPLSRRQTPETQVSASQQKELHMVEAQYLVARQKEISRSRAECSESQMASLERDMRTALAVIRKSLSPARYEEMVERGVNDKLLKQYAFPEFELWKSQQRNK